MAKDPLSPYSLQMGLPALRLTTSCLPLAPRGVREAPLLARAWADHLQRVDVELGDDPIESLWGLAHRVAREMVGLNRCYWGAQERGQDGTGLLVRELKASRLLARLVLDIIALRKSHSGPP